MHPRDGTLRAYQVDSLPLEERERLERHLKGCPRCQARALQLEQRRRFVHTRMKHLQTLTVEPSASSSAKLMAFQKRISRKEKEHMIRSPKWRPVWIAFIMLMAAALALSFPQVRAVANNFLGLFRVERVQVVPVDMPLSPTDKLSETTLQNLEQFFAQQVNFEDGGDSVSVSTVEEARALVGFEVRLPAFLGEPTELRVQPGGQVTFYLDVALANAILEELGQKDVRLPDSVNNAPVEVVVSDAVFAAYGTCYDEFIAPEAVDESTPARPIPLNADQCTTLLQMPSPTISAPPELNLTLLGEAYLQILGMSRQEAESFARLVDWTSTFVIPIPRYSAQHRELEVDGVVGTYIKYQGELRYVLIWVRQGIIYALSGQGGSELAQDIANSMK